MKKGLHVSRLVWQAVALVGLALLLILILQSRPGQKGAPLTAEITAYPPPAAPATAAVGAPSDPYPPPHPTRTPYPPAKVQALLGKRSQLGDVTTVTLERGRIWLIPPEGPPTTVTDYTDVAALYGWNYAGGKLLFGRGVYETRGGLAPATELWVYDLKANKSFRLADSRQVWSASWSPVDDRVAYCEYGEPPVMFVVDLDGKIQQKRENLLWDFAWSPDGSVIAVRFSGPEMLVLGEKFSVLGIWRLEKDDLQLISEAKREDHSNPVWMIDGKRIIFTRIFGSGSEPGKDGLYQYNVELNQIERLAIQPEYITYGVTRSPRSNDLIFNLGYFVYVMEVGREPMLIAKGSKPIWGLNGKTIFFYDENGQPQGADLNLTVKKQIIGGYIGVHLIELQPDMNFTGGISQ